MITARQVKECQPGTILASCREAQGYSVAVVGQAGDWAVYTKLFEVTEDHPWTPSLASRMRFPVLVTGTWDALGAIERYVAGHGSKQHLSQARVLFDVHQDADELYRA